MPEPSVREVEVQVGASSPQRSSASARVSAPIFPSYRSTSMPITLGGKRSPTLPGGKFNLPALARFPLTQARTCSSVTYGAVEPVTLSGTGLFSLYGNGIGDHPASK